MAIPVTFLSKGPMASRTDKRLLSTVQPEVVLQVAQLAEHLMAGQTLKLLLLSTCHLIEDLCFGEFSGLRDRLGLGDLTELANSHVGVASGTWVQSSRCDVGYYGRSLLGLGLKSSLEAHGHAHPIVT